MHPTRVLIIGLVAAVALVLGAPSSVRAEALELQPGRYTLAQAIELGIINPSNVTPPAGMDICPPADAAKAAIAPEASPPSHRAPRCFSNPLDLAKVIVIVRPPQQAVTAVPNTFSTTAALFEGYRFSGPRDPAANQRGGSMLAEVSDPSVCHASCPTPQHLYVRTSLTTPANNVIETGWMESNIDPTGNSQKVVTVTWRAGLGEGQVPMLHDAWTLVPGNQYAFRQDHCGFPGELLVCMEIWNGESWTVLRTWDEMRCLNSNGTFNCEVDFFVEAHAADDTTWFNLNGGADGLRTQNIEIKRDWWDLFTTGSWLEEAPYSICRVFDYYHFTAFRGPPSC